MKALLAKIALHKAVGLYVGDGGVTLSQAAATPFGPVELARRSEPYEADRLGTALESLLRPFLARGRRGCVPVALGLSPLRVFFSTRPIRTTKKDASPQILLHEVLQSPAVSVDDMVVDLIRAQPGKRKVASIVSCRKKYLSGLLALLDPKRVRLVRVEPGPTALLRAGALALPAPRRARTVLRFFLGAAQGLAVVTTSGLPIVWRTFELPAGGERTALCSATRALQALIVHCGVDSAPDVLLVHGRPDLHPQLKEESLAQELGVRLLTALGPALDDSAIAFGLAVGALGQGGETFDLARTLKPQPSLLEIFPWGEVTVQLAVLACMGFFWSARAQDVAERYRAVQLEAQRSQVLLQTPEATLADERQKLGARVEAVRKFLDSRALWSAYTHDIANRQPGNMALASFQGQCELETGAGKKAAARPKKSFILKASAPISSAGATPREIDDFMESLREHPLLKKDFPQVELADIRWSQGAGAKPLATFTVVCLPKSTKGGATK